MLSRLIADILAAGLMSGGILAAAVVALRYIRRNMTREDWAASLSLDGARRARFMRVHGLRFLGLLVGVFVYLALVGTIALPLIDSATEGQAAEAAQSQ